MENNNLELSKEQILLFAMYQIDAGKSDYEVEQALLMKNLNQEEAQIVIKQAHLAIRRSQQEGAQHGDEGSGVSGWLVWIGILILINILSAIFDWPFWIY